MPSKRYSIEGFALSSTWSCTTTLTANGLRATSTTPTTASRVMTVDVTGIPSGAQHLSGVLMATLSSPSTGAAVSTIAGIAVGTGREVTVPITITGNGTLSIPAAFRANGATHKHAETTTQHSSVMEYTDITLTVNYDDPASRITLDKSAVDAGGTVIATIQPTDPGYSHRIVVQLGSASVSYSKAAGDNTQMVTIPENWLQQMTTSGEAAATVTLTTLSGSTTLGTSLAALTVRAPATSGPDFNIGASRVLEVGGKTYPDMGMYVQNKSGLHAAMWNIKGQYGATIQSTRISGCGATSDTTTMDTGLLTTAGTREITFTATDSRGISTTKTMTVQVAAYSLPVCERFEAYRSDDSGNADELGSLGAFRAAWHHTALDGANSLTVTLAVNGASVTLTTDGESQGLLLPGNVQTLDPLMAYDAVLTLTDGYGETKVTRRIDSANFALHLSADGTALAIGKACEHGNAVEVSGSRTLYHGVMTGESAADGYTLTAGSTGYRFPAEGSKTADVLTTLSGAILAAGGTVAALTVQNALTANGGIIAKSGYTGASVPADIPMGITYVEATTTGAGWPANVYGVALTIKIGIDRCWQIAYGKYGSGNTVFFRVGDSAQSKKWSVWRKIALTTV